MNKKLHSMRGLQVTADNAERLFTVAQKKLALVHSSRRVRTVRADIIDAPAPSFLPPPPQRSVFERSNVSETFFPRGLRALRLRSGTTQSRSKRVMRSGSSKLERRRCATPFSRGLRAKSRSKRGRRFGNSTVARSVPEVPERSRRAEGAMRVDAQRERRPPREVFERRSSAVPSGAEGKQAALEGWKLS